MAPVPDNLMSTPKRPQSSRKTLLSTAVTNRLIFKMRTFKIPKCSLQELKNMSQLRDHYLSPLSLLEEDYREFSKSLEDVRPRRLDSELTDCPVPQNSPSGLVSENTNPRRVSDTECDYSFYHAEEDCNCKECESPVYWSDDSEDEDGSDANGNSVILKTDEEVINSRINGIAITEDVVSNSVGLSDLGIDMSTSGGRFPGFDLKVLDRTTPNSGSENYAAGQVSENDSGFDMHSCGYSSPHSSFDTNANCVEMQIMDSSLEVEAIGMQIQNLHLETNDPRRVSINEPVDELIINLFPHETVESLFPTNFSCVKYNFTYNSPK